MSYPAAPWAEHPERLQVLAAHGEMLWSLLERFGSRIREEAIFRREMNRYANQATCEPAPIWWTPRSFRAVCAGNPFITVSLQ
jgi:hypothetical protein